MRFGMWFGLFCLLGAIVEVSQIAWRQELMSPGLQYANENSLMMLSSIFGPISYLVLPNFFLLSLLAGCIGAKGALSLPEKVAFAFGGIGSGCLLFLIFAESANLTFVMSCVMLTALASSVLLGWCLALSQSATLGARPRAWGRWLGICYSAFGVAMAVVTAFVLLLSIPLMKNPNFGSTFFDPAAADGMLPDPLLYQHLLWFFGHPEIVEYFPISFVLSLFAATAIWAGLKAFRLITVRR